MLTPSAAGIPTGWVHTLTGRPGGRQHEEKQGFPRPGQQLGSELKQQPVQWNEQQGSDHIQYITVLHERIRSKGIA
jgi:hypothetical protein